MTLTVIAQNGFIIRGKIIDEETGELIIGANIVELDNNNRFIKGTITDVNGNFSFKVDNRNSIISVSYIGYKTVTIPIEGKKDFEIKMKSESVGLDEINVVAEKIENSGLNLLPKSSSAASSSKVDMEAISGVQSTSIAGALQGAAAGLDIIGSSGDPGAGSSIVIRGMSTLSGGNPLIVIDDMPFDQKVDENFDFGSSDAQDLSDLLSIPMEDMENIQILKDAAATAVYGSRAANGVILIKTKSGTIGKTRFAYNFKHSINIQPPSIPMLNGDEYVTLQREQLFANGDGIYSLPPELAFDPSFNDFYNYSQNTDWVNAITQNGFDQNHYFGLSGGGDKTRYYASVSNSSSKGTTINTGLNRLATRVKLDYNVSSNLKILTNFAYSNVSRTSNYTFNKSEMRNSYGFSNFKNWSLREMAYIKAPNMSIYRYTRDGELTSDYFSPEVNYQGDGVQYYNPIALSENGYSKIYQDILTANLAINYKILKSVKFESMVSYGYTGQQTKSFLPANAIGVDWLKGVNNKADNGNADVVVVQTRNQLTYKPKISDDHFLSAALAVRTYERNSENLYTSAASSPSKDITDPSAGLAYGRINSSKVKERMVEVVSRISYVLKDRYTIDGGVTLDGKSKLSRKNRWGMFPFISTAWQIQKEPFFNSVSWIDELKLRGSYGITGNVSGDAYVYFANYNSPEVSTYINNSVIEPRSIQLDGLGYSKLAQLNLGLDISAFNNRFNATVEVYTKITRDILWPRLDIPSSSGFSKLKFMNGGEMENKGIDFSMDGTIIKTKNLMLRLNFNISHNQNQFNSIPENFTTSGYSSTENEEYGRRLVLGEPLGSFYGYKYLGVWASDEDVVAFDRDGNVILDVNGNPKPLVFQTGYQFRGGDAKYADLNYDGKIDAQDMTYLGDSNPLFLGSVGSFFKYKGFSFKTQFYYRYGFDIVNAAGMRIENMNSKNNQSKAVLYRWRTQGDNFDGIIPRAVASSSVPNTLGSDRFVEDASYIRFKNLTLSYIIPS
ncbi:MAG: SusC/RagA family TonB-linked outer membrane protein, partial [Prolixibacteraceae bacterium]|nr:SusC/RagA family TonB-linked outer membrane protein [Prolixibacteraceae bacterium]